MSFRRKQSKERGKPAVRAGFRDFGIRFGRQTVLPEVIVLRVHLPVNRLTSLRKTTRRLLRLRWFVPPCLFSDSDRRAVPTQSEDAEHDCRQKQECDKKGNHIQVACQDHLGLPITFQNVVTLGESASVAKEKSCCIAAGLLKQGCRSVAAAFKNRCRTQRFMRMTLSDCSDLKFLFKVARRKEIKQRFESKFFGRVGLSLIIIFNNSSAMLTRAG